MKVDEYVFDVVQKVEKKTSTDYNIMWKDAENVDGYITADDLFTMVEDLLYEIDYLEEKIEDLERYIENSKEKFDPYYEYGVSERDFH